MAREISINLWCDQCATAGLRVPGQTATIGLLMLTATSRMDRAWSTVELCDECRDKLLTPLEKLISEVGAPASDTPKANPDVPRQGRTLRRGRTPLGPPHYPCLLCDVPFSSMTGMQRHSNREHHTTGTTLLELFGTRCPLCKELASTSLGLTRHVQREHDQPTIPIAFQRAELDGDPYGLVAQVRANSTTGKG